MCLASPDADLRLTAVESITEKIRETYIKSKPWIVYPLIVAALDEHPGVRYIINSFLLWESKIIIEKYFSGLVCFANNYVVSIKLSSLFYYYLRVICIFGNMNKSGGT